MEKTFVITTSSEKGNKLLDEETYQLWRAAGYIGNVKDYKLFGQIVKEEAEKKSNADKS